MLQKNRKRQQKILVKNILKVDIPHKTQNKFLVLLYHKNANSQAKSEQILFSTKKVANATLIFYKQLIKFLV